MTGHGSWAKKVLAGALGQQDMSMLGITYITLIIYSRKNVAVQQDTVGDVSKTHHYSTIL
jgi:hypothetical protein